ncbi:MAG: hypothetical protein RIC55_20785 [Pirellulaceae bacterium]
MDEYAPLILLFRDPDLNRIRAAALAGPLSFDGFPYSVSFGGEIYTRAPHVLTFWDHLSLDGQQGSFVLGIRLWLTRPHDSVLLDSTFRRAQPENLSVASDFEECGIFDIHLAGSEEELQSDFAQAFGSQYYLHGSEVILALEGWSGVRYGFPIDAGVLHALNG